MTEHPGKYLADLERRFLAMRTERDGLLAKVAELEAALARALDIPKVPRIFRLTKHETHVLECLLARAQASREQIQDFLYQLMPDGDDEPDIKIVDVFIHKVRKKLAPWKIEIMTEWGLGYRLTGESRDIIRDLNRAEALDAVGKGGANVVGKRAAAAR